MERLEEIGGQENGLEEKMMMEMIRKMIIKRKKEKKLKMKRENMMWKEYSQVKFSILSDLLSLIRYPRKR